MRIRRRLERAAASAGGKAENENARHQDSAGKHETGRHRCSETWPHHNDIRAPMREATLCGRSRLGASHPIVMAAPALPRPLFA